MAVSALTGEGLAALAGRFEADVTHDNISLALSLEASDGAGLAWAYRHAQVLERRDTGGQDRLSLRIHPQDVRHRFAKSLSQEKSSICNSSRLLAIESSM